MHLRVACSAGAFALLVLAACGSSKPAATASEPSGAADTTTTTSATGNADATAYRDCLTQHGVTTPNRGASTPPDSTPRGSFPNGPNGTQDPATQASFAACASLRPSAGNGFGNRGANSQALQAYFSCLRDNGVAVPDATATGPPPSIDRASPAFAAANAKCQVLLPQRGDGSTTTTMTTTSGG
jgi:hypothetical protein